MCDMELMMLAILGVERFSNEIRPDMKSYVYCTRRNSVVVALHFTQFSLVQALWEDIDV